MYCRNCGKPLEDDSLYCAFCGVHKTSILPSNNHSSIVASNNSYSATPVRPWIRYFARMLDIYFYTILCSFCSALILGFVLYVIDHKIYGLFLNFVTNHERIYAYIVFVTYVFVEPVLLSKTGTTFGKFIFNTKVKNMSENRDLSYKEAFIRSRDVFIKGLGLGIPIISLITLLNSHSLLKKTSTTSWDTTSHSIVLHGKQSPFRIIAGFIFVLILYAVLMQFAK